MDEVIEKIISTNCYLPGPPVLEVLPKIIKRELTEEELKEIPDFIRTNAPFPGCRRFFDDCREKKDCVWRDFL